MERLKVAVVGFGFMGVTHTMNILKNKDLELVAIVDKNPDNISKNLDKQAGNLSTGTFNKNEISNVHIYSTFEECIGTEQLDACIIAVHTDFHYKLTKLALEAGINVFLEKPFCLDIAEGEELIELTERLNLLLMIGHVVRFMPPYQRLKKWIDSDEFGSLKFLSLTRFSGVPAWGQWKEKQKDFGSSGGALFDLVIHDIDFVQWVLGMPDSIESTILPGKLSKHDYLNAIWKYKSGINVKIEGGNTFHTAFPFQAGFSANFEKASILYGSSNAENIIVATDTEVIQVPAGDAMIGYSEEMDYFARCLIKGERPKKCMPESALQTIQLGYKHI
ncbi:MAG TPA: Gfo/Idh/MocA family oxidoreductase [Draconibacterium sp.]|nr:Gfo/Idh/MocA family oxidoreductase [Draconibacterium sp.]